jgi:hypothetical protein
MQEPIHLLELKNPRMVYEAMFSCLIAATQPVG